MSRSLRTLVALSGLAAAMAPPSAPTPADTRRPEPREREPRLAPERHASGRFYRAAPDGHVSRQQRRAAERREHFAHLRSTGMTRRDARFLTACAMHNRAVCRALDRAAAERREVAARRVRPVAPPDPRTAPFGTLRGDRRA